MPSYRLYFMRLTDGHIDRFEDFDAVNDEAALTFAKGKVNGHALELWEGHRKLHHFERPATAGHVLKVWSKRGAASPHPQSPPPPGTGPSGQSGSSHP